MEEDARKLPPKPLTVLTSIAVLTFLCAAMYWARSILIPIAMAVFFSFVLTPLVSFLQRRGLGRLPAVMVVISVAILVAAGVAVVVGQQMVHLTGTLPDHADRIKSKLTGLKEMVQSNQSSRFSVLIDDLTQIFDSSAVTEEQPSQTVVVKSSPSWVSEVKTYLSPAAEAIGQAAFTLILVVFMLLRREDLRNRVIRLLGPGRLATTTKAVDETSRRISQFLLAQLVLNSAFGLVISLGLYAMGIDYAPLWGFVAFLMRYVPYIGTWIGVIPPAVFTFAVSDGWGLTIGVVILFLGLELISNNIFEPLLYGSRLGLSEVALLVATAFWFFLWGPVGMILAWPLTTCLLVCGKYVPQLRFLSVLLGDQPVLPTKLAFYQRVAAKDQDEASQILEKELTTNPRDVVFENTLLASLVEARRDADENRISQAELQTVLRTVREIAEDAVDEDDTELVQPVETRLRVLVAPAKDAVDEAAGELLSHLLGPKSWEVEVTSAEILTSELLDQIEKFQPAILVIASIPPGGITHTRFLCKRVRRRFPDVKVVIGRWADPNADTNAVAQQLRDSGADEVTWTLGATSAHLDGWRTVLANENPENSGDSAKSKTTARIGTVSATV